MVGRVCVGSAGCVSGRQGVCRVGRVCVGSAGCV